MGFLANIVVDGTQGWRKTNTRGLDSSPYGTGMVPQQTISTFTPSPFNVEQTRTIQNSAAQADNPNVINATNAKRDNESLNTVHGGLEINQIKAGTERLPGKNRVKNTEQLQDIDRLFTTDNTSKHDHSPQIPSSADGKNHLTNQETNEIEVDEAPSRSSSLLDVVQDKQERQGATLDNEYQVNRQVAFKNKADMSEKSIDVKGDSHPESLIRKYVQQVTDKNTTNGTDLHQSIDGIEIVSKESDMTDDNHSQEYAKTNLKLSGEVINKVVEQNHSRNKVNPGPQLEMTINSNNLPQQRNTTSQNSQALSSTPIIKIGQVNVIVQANQQQKPIQSNNTSAVPVNWQRFRGL